MSRFERQSVITVQNEVTYGVNPGSPVAADAILVSNIRPGTIQRDLVDRALVRNYLGGSEQMVASRRFAIDFDVELAGSGTAGTAPAWGKLLKAAGCAETITAANRVEYTPVSDLFPSIVLNYFLAGIRYISRGGRLNVKLAMNAYKIPYLMCHYEGFDTSAVAGSVLAGNYSAFQRPLVLTDANTGDIRLGGTYTAGAVSGGTVLASEGMEMDIGNTISHMPILGGEAVDITARETTGSMSVFLDAATEETWRTDINNNTLTALSFQLGATAGNRITVFAPAVQRVNPQPKMVNGKVFIQTELRFLPLAGNDEFRIVAR